MISVERYDYFLPEQLIADKPSEKRDNCRLLVLNRKTGELLHKRFFDLQNLLCPDYFLVMNNTRVMRARLTARKKTGGKSEAFVTEVLSKNTAYCLIRGSFKEGALLDILSHNSSVAYEARLIKKIDNIWLVEFSDDILQIMDSVGHIPLPAYIKRADSATDSHNYQTVYSKHIGSVAAPTAGLHFTHELIENLSNKGIESYELTLHVGLGTFLPIKSEYMKDHKMHSEYFNISKSVAESINKEKRSGRKLLAIGSTSTRALESSAIESAGRYEASAGSKSTDIFIYGDYNFKLVDAMITNFHLPKSTLLAMVSSFAGYDYIMHAYEVAIKEGYRFYSYGDAMLII